MTHRLAAMHQIKYKETTKTLASGKIAWTGKINLDEEALQIPLRRKKPTMYFCNSMSDLFHENVPDEFIDKVFAVMALCPQHTFQVLTKRPKRMRDYCFRAIYFDNLTDEVNRRYLDMTGVYPAPVCPDDGDWPLANVWLGVSVEDQQRADERIPLLIRTPATVRFLSCEPLLEDLGKINLKGIGWCIIGCESGPKRRPMKLEWAEYIVHQCKQANVACFMKQMEVAGKVTDDMVMFPFPLRVREYPCP
jgi:protein gp37